MKLISINTLKIGEMLSCDIRGGNGNMLLRAKTILTEQMIVRLKSVGIYAVYVDDDMFEDVELRPALTDETKARILGSLDSIKANVTRGRKIDIDAAKLLGREIFEEVRIAVREPINMVSTFAIDSPILLHSVNVAMITAAIAVRSQIRPQLAENYVFAALMHDMFLDDIQSDNKPPFEHTQKFYDYFKNTVSIDATSYMAGNLHHERFDGTGPKKIKGTQINEGARIIAVADMYDSCAEGFAGYKRMEAYQAVEFVNAQANTILDPDFVKVFATCVAIYPTGATVIINNGIQAMVLRQNDGMPTRPVLRLLSKDPAERMEINMLTNNAVFIEKVAL